MTDPAILDVLSVAVLCSLIAVLFYFYWRGARRTRFSLWQYALYLYGTTLARVLWRGRVIGELPLPDGTGAIIVCNHRGPFDPAFVQLATRRIVHWMVAREYCENPALGWFFRAARCIPTRRAGIDTAATKMAIRYAQAGDLVGMFPEGRINTTEQVLLPGRPGVALVALKAQVPVIPCFVTGSPAAPTILGSMFRPAKATIRIGPLLDVSEYYGREKERAVLELLTRKFLCAMATLAECHHYEPQLAGRRWRPEDA